MMDLKRCDLCEKEIRKPADEWLLGCGYQQFHSLFQKEIRLDLCQNCGRWLLKELKLRRRDYCHRKN